MLQLKYSGSVWDSNQLKNIGLFLYFCCTLPIGLDCSGKQSESGRGEVAPVTVEMSPDFIPAHPHFSLRFRFTTVEVSSIQLFILQRILISFEALRGLDWGENFS